LTAEVNLSEAEANYSCLQVAHASWDNTTPELSRYAAWPGGRGAGDRQRATSAIVGRSPTNTRTLTFTSSLISLASSVSGRR